MPLEKNKFRFQSHYIGWWHRPEQPYEKLSGALFIENQKIWLELYFEPDNSDFPQHLDTLSGCVCAVDNDGHEYAVNITVEGLNYNKWIHHEDKLWHYKYTVSNIFIYEGAFCKDMVGSVNIRAMILDEWAANVLQAAYIEIPYEQIPHGHHVIYHTPPQHYLLLNNEKMTTYLFFSYSYTVGGVNRGVKQKAFLRISFKERCSFHEALYIVNQIQYLFYLLTNQIFPVDYLYVESINNAFFYKANDSILYRYIDNSSNIEPHSQLNDFSECEIQSIFQKWIELYSNYSDAINSYFETRTNIYNSPASCIKNYISTIDTLSKTLKGTKGNIDLTTNRAKYLLRIIEKYKINNSDSNELKSRFLNTSGVELKTRFSKLIEAIEDYIPLDLEPNFIVKIVNTRHNIIHPQANQQPCYSSMEYKKAASQLNFIILSYLLVLLEVKDDIIKKIRRLGGYNSYSQ